MKKQRAALAALYDAALADAAKANHICGMAKEAILVFDHEHPEVMRQINDARGAAKVARRKKAQAEAEL